MDWVQYNILDIHDLHAVNIPATLVGEKLKCLHNKNHSFFERQGN